MQVECGEHGRKRLKLTFAVAVYEVQPAATDAAALRPDGVCLLAVWAGVEDECVVSEGAFGGKLRSSETGDV